MLVKKLVEKLLTLDQDKSIGTIYTDEVGYECAYEIDSINSEHPDKITREFDYYIR